MWTINIDGTNNGRGISYLNQRSILKKGFH